MAGFKLDRFKYVWKGDWQADTDYIRDDIVRVGGRTYVCVIGHTSSPAFRTDQEFTIPDSDPPISEPRWIVMTQNKSFVGTWLTGTNYNYGDIVLYQGSLYACIVPHVATEFSTDAEGLTTIQTGANSNWELFSLGSGYQTDWESSISYGVGTVVKYGGIVYKCILAHLSSVFEDQTDNWQVFYENYDYKQAWTPTTFYKVNDLVKYGASIFKCVTAHTSSSLELDNEKFILEIPGSQYDNNWSSTQVYNQGDIVKYGGYLYYALNNNYDVQPSITDDSSSYWSMISKNYNFKGLWNKDYSVSYQTGDVIQRGGYIYQALKDVNLVNNDLSSTDYLDTDVWKLLVPGKIFIDAWSIDQTYAIGEVIIYRGSAYTCNFEHVSTTDNFPGDNGNVYNYWDLLIEAGNTAGMLYSGDILTYGLTREEIGDGSTVGDTRVAIGNTEQFLSVTEELEVFWRNFGINSDVIYVGVDGKNKPGYGMRRDKPFRSIQYACQYVEDNITPGLPVKISVSTGRYEEICPIIVPAGCVVMGDELRSTTVIANSAFDSYSDAYKNYFFEAFDYIETILFDLLNSVEIDKQPGNNFDQTLINLTVESGVPNLFVSLLENFKNYVNSRLGDGNVPSMTGTNTLNTNQDRKNAVIVLRSNYEFLANEVYHYINNTYPNELHSHDQISYDVHQVLRGITRDLQYDGNYLTLLAAKRFANSMLGSQSEDMFYMRDTTGLRNMTLEGLSGILNPPGTYIAYRRPTGGSYVSLDPGWGPADNRTWIINRSPYLQGVTNVGTACIGNKIDGSLHNGGNRSMVSNDFTQVLSDGVGVWVLNNARAELVSVFTYYCQIGYFAENGGIIRATNGNNSYGNFGSIAQGVNADEIPINAVVNNRKNQADIIAAIAGGVNDEIKIFEYGNAGESYTSAIADIFGAGVRANVEFNDFRDNALFESRLISTDSSRAGGSGYTSRQNAAQENPAVGTSGKILLNVNELITLPTDVIGMRLIIIQGTGVGQYGKIKSYTPVGSIYGSNFAQIERESDGVEGWDHVISGTTPLAPDSSSIYRIEACVTVPHPGFDSIYASVPNQRTFISGTTGGQTVSYFSIELNTGSGTVDEELTKISATVNVQRIDIEYFVTIINPGAGYLKNEEFTILGTELGGETPANDLVITVLENSDDSTNSIETINWTGVARGKRLIALADPNFVVYSDDAINWKEANTAQPADFTKIIAGNNRFVAIARNSTTVNLSLDGENWSLANIGQSADWVDIAYSNSNFDTDLFVAVAENENVSSYSNDGQNWNIVNLPTGDDSTGDQWQKIAYGQGRFIAITGSLTRDVAYADYNGNGITWSRYDAALPAGNYDWVGFEFGNNRFLALSVTGDVIFSLDRGASWKTGTTIPGNKTWRDLKYGQGVFVAICGEDIVATSEDGVVWRQEQLAYNNSYNTLLFHNLENTPEWVAIADSIINNSVARIKTGARAKLRAQIQSQQVLAIKIHDPGSGYIENFSISLTDPLVISSVETEQRIGNGVLAQPSFINRGEGYKTTTSVITITGDGYADNIPEDNTLTLDGIPAAIPGPGVQMRIAGVPDLTTDDENDLKLFTGVNSIDLGDDGSGNGTRTVRFTVSPAIKNENNVRHGTSVVLRTQYSQCRITGHDYLDIGTGNFLDTNYPELYASGRYFIASPENEVVEIDGGKVFYTSTDQDGNFRTGELFSVNQATGVVTISAEFFDLDGLTELSLGGVRLGGSGTVVNEFSTDPTFSADSNNIIPTQRAIITFLEDRLSVGGTDLETNSLTAGGVYVGGIDDVISTTTLNFKRQVIFEGADSFANPTAIQGTIISQMLFVRAFDESMQ